MKFKQKLLSNNGILAVVCTALILVPACSVGGNDSSRNNNASGAPQPTIAETVMSANASVTATVASTSVASAIEMASMVAQFTAANGSGTVAISGDGSPVAAWFADQPGEVSLDLADADVNEPGSVVEELVSFWFFQDDDSGDVPPSVFVSAGGDISDSVGTSYVVEAQGLPPAPVAETTTTTSSTSTASSTVTSSVPEISEAPSPATSSTTTTTSSTTTTTTAAVVESPVVLLVQVLNGSGVAGAAGRMTEKLSEAGFVVLPPENAPQRYSSSAVYYQEGWQDKAEEILLAAEIEEVDAPSAMPQQFATEEAAVIILLGTDTAPAVVREQAGLRPRQRNDVRLPLPASVPRDRYVPGLANIQIFSAVNDQSANTQVLGNLDAISSTLNVIGRYSAPGARLLAVDLQEGQDHAYLQTLYENLERAFAYFGFTPQNVCGAPAGYSFTDLLKSTREWNEEIQTYSGDAIFTTDRLLELHGGERINPEANLEFYIGEAVQTAYDSLRLAELSDEIEAPQMILCDAWKLPSGEIPEAANGYWYALLTPGIQPRESLMSQGTYHLKEISKNGNIAQVVVCHPTLGARYLLLHWREAGYRAEYVTSDLVERTSGCQAVYEVETYIYEDTNGAEDTFRFSFGERVFSAGGISGFPRS